jgi:Coenzyme PQQ synthesis protein D (PqqD)
VNEVDVNSIDGRFVPTAQPGVGSVLVGREIVLGLIAAGASHVQTAALNESGSIVWQCFDGSGTIDDIAADIAGVFGAEIEAVHADVVALARAVGAAGYLVGVHEAALEIGDELSRGIAAGLPYPDFTATQPGRRCLLVSWSATCQYCALIADELAELVPALAEAGVDVVLMERDDEAAFAGLGTPAAYLVDEHGLVAEPAALGATEVLAVARRHAA